MTPFATPLPALWITADEPIPVAVIATTDTEFMAVQHGGKVIIEGHAEFRLVGGPIGDAIWDAHLAMGS